KTWTEQPKGAFAGAGTTAHSSGDVTVRRDAVAATLTARRRRECGQCRCTRDGQRLPSEAPARDVRWLGEPPPSDGNRLPRRREPRAQGTPWRQADPTDRRPATTPGS